MPGKRVVRFLGVAPQRPEDFRLGRDIADNRRDCDAALAAAPASARAPILPVAQLCDHRVATKGKAGIVTGFAPFHGLLGKLQVDG